MKLYLAGAESDLNTLKKYNARILLSYYTNKDKKNLFEIKDSFPDIFLDSGAYSAFTKNKEIDVKDLINFIKKYKFKLYAGLDVIGDAKKTKRNCEIMIKEGLTDTIPTFHYSESIEYLNYYCSNFKYIAIGGLVPIKSSTEIFAFLNKCFSIIGRYMPIKVHGFGVGNSELLKRYPFYSADSTTWINGARFGEYQKFSFGDVLRVSSAELRLHNTGIAESLLTDSDENKSLYRCGKNVCEWMKFEEFVTELWEKRGVSWDA